MLRNIGGTDRFCELLRRGKMTREVVMRTSAFSAGRAGTNQNPPNSACLLFAFPSLSPMRSRVLLLFITAVLAFASTALAAVVRLQQEQEVFSTASITTTSTDLIRECDPKSEYLLS